MDETEAGGAGTAGAAGGRDGATGAQKRRRGEGKGEDDGVEGTDDAGAARLAAGDDDGVRATCDEAGDDDREAAKRRRKNGEDAANAAPPRPHALREGNAGNKSARHIPGKVERCKTADGKAGKAAAWRSAPTEHFPKRWEPAANTAVARLGPHGSQNPGRFGCSIFSDLRQRCDSTMAGMPQQARGDW